MGNTVSVRVSCVVVESLPLFREGLLRLLRQQLDLENVQALDTLAAGTETILQAIPSLAILDRDVCDRDVFECLEQMRSLRAQVRFLLTGTRFSDADLHRAAALGVQDCLLKSAETHVWRQTLKRLIHDPTVSSDPLEKRLRQSPGLPRLLLLSDRERQLLAELARGYTVCEVARRLNLSRKTLYIYRTTLMKKLGIYNHIALAHYAIREGLIRAWDDVCRDQAGERRLQKTE